jgi:hypothetical protein
MRESKVANACRLQTDAVVFHCPGPLRDPSNPVHLDWERAQKEFFADENGKGSTYFADDPGLAIITYNTRQDRALLERCMSHLGLSLTVLGRGAEGWRWESKITLVRDYLDSVDPGPHVMCLDAFDTLVLASPQEILGRFRQTSADLLFASTGSDWPPSESHRIFENQVSQDASPAHRHLNASYIGKTATVRSCLDEIVRGIEVAEPWCHTDSGFDDQLAWREMHRRYYPRLQIDTQCLIFSRFDKNR